MISTRRRQRLRTVATILFILFAGSRLAAQSEAVSISPDRIVGDATYAGDVEVSRFGSYIALYDTTEGNSVRLFDSELRERWRRRLSHYWSGSLEAGSILQFSPDESFVLFPGERDDNDICLCDTETGQPIDVLRGHEDDVGGLALSPDGQWLVSIASRDELLLWRRTDSSFEPMKMVDGFERAVHAIEFLPDSTGVVLSYRREQSNVGISLFKIEEERLVERSQFEFEERNISHEIYQIAISPDGETLAAGHRDSLLFFDLGNSELGLVQRIEEIDLGNVYSLDFGGDGDVLVSGHYGYVRWWRSRHDFWAEAGTGDTQSPVAVDVELSVDGHLYVAGRAEENALSRFSVHGVPPSTLGSILTALNRPLSRAQRRVLTPTFVKTTAAALGQGALAPRDMFETGEEYVSRLSEAGQSISATIAEAMEAQYGATEIENPAALYDLLLPIEGQGSYDIDNHRYDLRFMDTDASVLLDRSIARELYRNWEEAQIRVTRYERNGESGYADFRLLHPSFLAEYPLILERNPFTGELLNVARSYVPAIRVGQELLIRELELDGIFPTLYQRYSEEPFGRFIVENRGTGIVSDLSGSFTIEGLVDSPRLITLPASLAAGQSRPINLTAPFSEEVLRASEGRSATLSLQFSYRRGADRRQGNASRQIRVLNRNAIQWDDDRKIAAFMSVSDQELLKLSGQLVRSTTVVPTPALSQNLLYALQIFQALSTVGIEYVVDPNSAYEDLSGHSGAVDYLRFPRETLLAGAGDCDDLSALYATLLESVGVPTALITTPGHIFVAFDTGITPSQAKRVFYAPENLIMNDGTTWMPLETTLLDLGFARAWQTGALQWRQALARNEATLFSTREAWREYAPVSPPTTASVPVPEASRLIASVSEELDRFRAIELEPRLTELNEKVSGSNSAVIHNKRGVLYARYAMLEEAAEHFSAALEMRVSLPALINLSNILSLSGRYAEARAYLEQARELEPGNGRVLLGLALSHWQSGNQEEARSAYQLASEANPHLAEQFPLFSASEELNRASKAPGALTSLFATDWLEE